MNKYVFEYFHFHGELKCVPYLYVLYCTFPENPLTGDKSENGWKN